MRTIASLMIYVLLTEAVIAEVEISIHTPFCDVLLTRKEGTFIQRSTRRKKTWGDQDTNFWCFIHARDLKKIWSPGEGTLQNELNNITNALRSNGKEQLVHSDSF